MVTITPSIPEPAKRNQSPAPNIPPVSRPKVSFVFIAYDAVTATDHASTFDAINGRARTLYAAVKTKRSIAVFTTPIEAKLTSFNTKARLCQAAAI